MCFALVHRLDSNSSSPVSCRSDTMSSVWSHPGVRYVTLGWASFIAENLILSENRQTIIGELGESKYRMAYGSLSTLTMSSVAYGYFRHRPGPLLFASGAPGFVGKVAASGFQTMGLIFVAQQLPSLQLPLASASTPSSPVPPEPVRPHTQSTPSSEGGFVVRCPFDFAADRAAREAEGPYGLKRITRHPAFWTLGFCGLGVAFWTARTVTAATFAGPAFVALIGGVDCACLPLCPCPCPCGPAAFFRRNEELISCRGPVSGCRRAHGQQTPAWGRRTSVARNRRGNLGLAFLRSRHRYPVLGPPSR